MGSGKSLEVTDQRIAGAGGSRRAAREGRRTFQTEDVIGKLKDLQFLPLNDKVMIPDVPWHLPLGELLREVKLHRARGGCLGAKSR